MDESRKSTISVLRELIGVCREVERLYKTAASEAKDENLKQLLLSSAQEKTDYRTKLESEVTRLGGVTGTETLSLSFNPDLIPATNNMEEILIECEKREETAVRNYRSAMEKDLLWEVVPVVSRQYFGLKASHDKLKYIMQEQFV